MGLWQQTARLILGNLRKHIGQSSSCRRSLKFTVFVKADLEQLFVRSSYLPTVLLAVGVDAVKTRSELAVLDQTPELFQINFIVTVKFLGRKEPRVNGLCRFRAFLAHVITAKAYDTTR